MKRNFLLSFAFLAIFSIANIYAQTSAIKMNEIYSRGTTTDPDWIEIYNSSFQAIDITGYKIYDNGGQGGTKPKMEFPSGTTIPARGYYVIVTDIPTSTNPAGFGLSSGGEKVWLEDKMGAIVDSITFPAMTETQTYRRIPDGGEWKLADSLTKGYANSLIVMNEIYSRGTTADPDWIEIYNSSSKAIDISGYKIYDNGGQGGTKPKMEFSSGTSVPAKGFYVIVTDIPTSTNPAGFGLSSSGEPVWLEDKNGNLIDSVTFLAHETTQSYARVPDGGAWKVVTGLTKGATNNPTTDVKKNNDVIVKNYILSQNYPNPFNPSTQINFSIPSEKHVTLKIYDLLGKEVRTLINRNLKAGSYNISFEAKNLTSGIYFYKLETDDFVQMKKMVLMK
ncbi:MAG TPA: lamin tail domain-containing protein [Bacteroidota bacterium]|jgi:predicted extracellular nuclease|nr:lamin tail domain-containing protein [Bacteroidota bacterium]